MKCVLLLLLLLTPFLAFAERATPPRPRSRIEDQANIFNLQAKGEFSKLLRKEYERYRVSIYVATLPSLDKNEAVPFANRLRQAWIEDDLGVVILYAENTDKISISLSKSAFKRVSLGGDLDKLASEIDGYNEKGAELGLPKTANALLDRLRVRYVAAPAAPESTVRKSVVVTAFYLLLGFLLSVVAGFGLWKLFGYFVSHNVFTSSYVIRPGTVKPILGSTIGGVNTVEGKF